MVCDRVLIVEDNKDLRQIYKRAFERAGFAICEAGNGQEALDALGNSTGLPSLIVLDLMMPVMDGWSFLKEYERQPELAEVPVLLVSACAERAPAGYRVVSKPVDVKKLVELAIEHACSSPPA